MPLTMLELSQALFGRGTEKKTPSEPFTGIAVTASVDGHLVVHVDGQEFDCPTSVSAEAGQTVYITTVNGSPIVTAVVGWGDELDARTAAAVVASWDEYAISDNPTVAPMSGWSKDQPVWTDGNFIWRRAVTSYGDGTTVEGVPACMTGNPGSDGKDGQSGKDGLPGSNGQMLYGASNTAAAESAKTPASNIDGFSLYVGSTVGIKFTYANTADAPTLNINNTGAKPILTNGVVAAYWDAGATITFIYNGTHWCCASSPVYATTATIGNPAGGNLYIDGNGVYIRRGSDVLASLIAGALELAAKEDAIIKLCGGKGTIAYYAETDQLAIMAPGSIAMTACQTLPDGTVQPWDAGIACNRYGVLAKGAVEVSGTLTKNSETVYAAKTLYNNASGTTGTVTLSETAANFSFIDIHYTATDGVNMAKGTTRVASPNGSVVGLYSIRQAYDANKATSFSSKRVTISGATISVTDYGSGAIILNSVSWVDNTNNIYVTKVVGYR